jgi:hypothetical protein
MNAQILQEILQNENITESKKKTCLAVSECLPSTLQDELAKTWLSLIDSRVAILNRPYDPRGCMMITLRLFMLVRFTKAVCIIPDSAHDFRTRFHETFQNNACMRNNVILITVREFSRMLISGTSKSREQSVTREQSAVIGEGEQNRLQKLVQKEVDYVVWFTTSSRPAKIPRGIFRPYYTLLRVNCFANV